MNETRSDRVAKVVFAISGLVLAFIVGAAFVAYKLPPYWKLVGAKSAVIALLDLEDDSLMPMLRLDPEAPARPKVSQLDPGAGTEPLLLTGGFYQNMDECPTFGCIASIIDRTGKTLFTWETDPAKIAEAAPEEFAGKFGADNIYPIGVALLPDGDLSVTFHTRNSFPYQAGIARIGRDGTVKWVDLDHSHHWQDTDEAGNTYSPSARIVPTPEPFEGTSVFPTCKPDKVMDEGIRVRDGDGRIVRDYWMHDILLASGLPGLLYSVRNGCDPYHINSVEVVTPDIAAQLPGVEAGDFLVSVREQVMVAIVGHEDGRIRYSSVGQVAGQHSAHFLPDATVVVFDNQGGAFGAEAGTRIVRLDLRTGSAETVYPRSGEGGGVPLQSDDGGTISVSPDGERIMISSKNQARSFEVDLDTGTPLWTLDIGYDISKYLAATRKTADAAHAWFTAYGVYYLSPADIGFLER